MNRLSKISFLVLACVLLLSMTAYGQQERGTVSGIVTAEDSGDPLGWVMVSAYQVDGNNWPAGMAWANSSGEYELSVPYGDYHVKARSWNYISEWWEEVPNRDEASAVTVDEENNPENINFTLATIVYGGIAGTITDAATEEPIRWAWVVATGTEEPYSHRWALTNSDGEYEMELMSGTYEVEAYANGYIEGAIDEPVVVEDEVVTGVDIALMSIIYGSISGTVYDNDSGEPVENARIKARMVDGWHGGSTRSGSEGDYVLENLRPGDYRLTAYGYGYFSEVYPDIVTVVGDENVPDIDFYLGSSEGPFDGFISGMVTDEETSEPIVDALLMVVSFGSWYDFRINFTHSGEDGSYLFDDLPPLEYKIFCNASGYSREFYDNKDNWWDADIVTPDVENIDFALGSPEPGPRFLGGLVYENNQPVPGAIVFAKQDGEVKYNTVTYPDGSYDFVGINAGIYNIEVISPSQNEGSLVNKNVLFSDVCDADVTISVTSIDDDVHLPVSTTLSQNYPNPFNASTEIRFSLPVNSNVQLDVYNLLGQKAATLLKGEVESGDYSITWDAGDLPSGVYFAVLSTGGSSESVKMVLLK
ncbi:MAG: carboxypeptidase regulatory-like domain-containing protein [candidate division Zixibacteria bacterium]